jgi:hypothetical protein
MCSVAVSAEQKVCVQRIQSSTNANATPVAFCSPRNSDPAAQLGLTEN